MPVWLVALLPVIVSLVGGWAITNRVTDRWDRKKKQRELDLAAAQEFQRLYGEFVAIWKSWNSALRLAQPALPADEYVWECLKRSAAAEGGLEALLAKIASEHCLSEDDLNALGAVRQGFQRLRQVIRHRRELPWHSSNVDEYLALKGLCAYVSMLLDSPPDRIAPGDRSRAAANFQQITDNKHEDQWINTARKLQLINGNDSREPGNARTLLSGR